MIMKCFEAWFGWLLYCFHPLAGWKTNCRWPSIVLSSNQWHCSSPAICPYCRSLNMIFGLCDLQRYQFWLMYGHHTDRWDPQVSQQQDAMFNYGIEPLGTYWLTNTKFLRCTYANSFLNSSQWGQYISTVFELFLLDAPQSGDYMP